MSKPRKTSPKEGLFLVIPIGMTPSDERLILRLQAELSAGDQPEVSQRQVMRLAVRFAGQTHAKNKLFSLIRQQTTSAVEERRLKRGNEKYRIRSFSIYSKDMPAFKNLSKELWATGLSHTRSDVIRGSLRTLVELSAHLDLWRKIRTLNTEIAREFALHDRRRAEKK